MKWCNLVKFQSIIVQIEVKNTVKYGGLFIICSYVNIVKNARPRNQSRKLCKGKLLLLKKRCTSPLGMFPPPLGKIPRLPLHGLNFCQFSKLSKMQKKVLAKITHTIFFAVIRKEFEVPPYSQSVELGSQIQLRCHPPKGVPKPRVSVPQ